MKYFFDTEFIDKGKSIDLISIGIVAEDGREYYAVSSEYNKNDADDWVKENVLCYVKNEPKITNTEIKEQILAFIGNDPEPSFWGWYSAYDWVLFCQLFGRMIDVPKPLPMYVNDLRSVTNTLHAPNDEQHNALADARQIKAGFEFFISRNIGEK